MPGLGESFPVVLEGILASLGMLSKSSKPVEGSRLVSSRDRDSELRL
jgi:hypothetical protein